MNPWKIACALALAPCLMGAAEAPVVVTSEDLVCALEETVAALQRFVGKTKVLALPRFAAGQVDEAAADRMDELISVLGLGSPV